MPRILLLASISKAFYNFSFEFLEELKAQGFEVILSIPEDPLNPEFERIGCTVIPAPLNRHGMNPLAELRLFGEYIRLICKWKPDVVMSFTIKPNTYGGIAAGLLRVPFLASVTGMGTVFYNDTAVNKVIRRMLKAGLRNANCIFFQNDESLAEFQRQKMFSCRSSRIPGSGVNLEKRPQLPYPGTEKIRFLMEARASKEKGVAEYITAAEETLKKYPDCEFHYAGFTEEGEYGDMLHEAAEKGIIRYHGFLNNAGVEELMKSVHCVVLPSYHEGMSNVLLEGAAYGRPLLCSDVPGCRETVIPEKSGFLFPARSAAALQEAFERFIALPQEAKKAMGDCGRKYIETHFDRKRTIAAYFKEIREVLK